jgi:uncharacterized membrane protein
MDDIKRIELMESNLNRMTEWIGNHDSKASFALGIATAMLAVLVDSAAAARGVSVFALILAGLAAALLALVFWQLFRGAFPNTTVFQKATAPSLFFFGTITGLHFEDFQNRVEQLDTATCLQDLTAQCFEIAKIVSAKFMALRRAYLFLFISLAPWTASILWLKFISGTTATSGG